MISLTGLRRLAAVLAPLMLCACGADDRSPFADSRPPPGLPERFYPPENWAWGLVQADGGPPQRYGVAAPLVTARADVLILPDYGETAETWFETARDLGGAGYAVWVLEGVGQGGSGRLSGRRDTGEVRSFDPDVNSARAFIDEVIRPQPRRPLVLLGQGVGALIAARAAETGARPAALVLSSALCGGGLLTGTLIQLGFGGMRGPGGGPWRRDEPDDFALRRTHDAWRGAVTQAWQVANPDLRLGGPSLDWRAALAELQSRAQGDAAKIATPTLILEPSGAAACVAPIGATVRAIPAAGDALELEDDARRGPWLAAIEAMIAQAAARADPAASGHVP